jgi:L-threonylcarbamoyladenylate synthase
MKDLKVKIEDVAKQLDAGRLVVHPTDTLFGITFDPDSVTAHQQMLILKGRDASKGLIALCSNSVQAYSLWAELSRGWKKVLQQLWPGPISVIFTANDRYKTSVFAVEETIAVRVPSLPVEYSWYQEVLKNKGPLPTTSANKSGTAPLDDMAIIEKVFAGDVFISDLLKKKKAAKKNLAASTLMKITGDQFEILREGSVSIDTVQALVNRYVGTHTR